MPTPSTATLASLVVGGALEGFAGVALLTTAGWPGHPIASVLLSHWAACGLLTAGVWPRLPPSFRKDKSISLLLILGLSIPLPVVGPVLVLVFTQSILKREHRHPLEPDFHFGDRSYLSGPEQSAGNSLTRSLIEHLGSPEVEVRRDAVLAAGRLEFRAALPILRLAQQDGDERVRIFARNTLGQIAEALEGTLKAIEHPDLDPPQRLERVIFVAEHFDAYVELGLASEGGRKAHLEKVIRLLTESLATKPDNEKTLCLLLKFCLRGRCIDEATLYLRALQQLTSSPEVTLPWELEILFESRDWPALSARLTTIRRSHSQHPDLMKIHDYWHSGAAAPE